MDWKKVSNDLVEIHKKQGSGIIPLDPHSKGEIVNLSDDDMHLEISGKELKAKKIRGFLWEHRKKRALQRKNAILWSSYLEDEDVSYVGVGALTSPETADRFEAHCGKKI